MYKKYTQQEDSQLAYYQAAGGTSHLAMHNNKYEIVTTKLALSLLVVFICLASCVFYVLAFSISKRVVSSQPIHIVVAG
jgi:hypothetical protein